MQFRVHADSKIPALRGRANKNELIKRPDPRGEVEKRAPWTHNAAFPACHPYAYAYASARKMQFFSSPSLSWNAYSVDHKQSNFGQTATITGSWGISRPKHITLPVDSWTDARILRNSKWGYVHNWVWCWLFRIGIRV